MQGERGVIKRYNGHVGVFERTLPLGNSYIYMYMCIVIRRQCIENENRNQNKCKSFCGDCHIHTCIYKYTDNNLALNFALRICSICICVTFNTYAIKFYIYFYIISG